MIVPDFSSLGAKYSTAEGKSVSPSHSFAQEDGKSGIPMSDREYIELIVSRIVASRIDITYHEQDWVHILLALASCFGESGRQYAHEISQFYVGKHKSYTPEEVDEKYDWCLKKGRGKFTLATVVEIAKSYGVDVSMPPGRYPENGSVMQSTTTTKPNARKEEPKTEPKRNATEMIIAKFASDYEFRCNKLTNRIEVLDLTASVPEWKEMDDIEFNTLYTRLKMSGIKTNKTDVDAIIDSRDYHTEYDPAMEYFDSLDPWNPEEHPGEDPIDELFDFIQVPDEQKEFARKYCRKWFLGLVAMMIGKISSNQLMLSLIGAMRTGKTHFCNNILPPGLRKYLKIVNPNEPLDRDLQISLSSCLLVVFDELKISSKTSNPIKAILSLDHTDVRAPYDRFSQQRAVRCSYMSTGNDKCYIAEEAGNRRFISLEVVSTKPIEEGSLPYEAAYAQAYYLVNQPDFKASLTPEEVQEIAEHNKEYVAPDINEEAILRCYRKPEDHETGIRVTATDVLEKINLTLRSPEITREKVGKALIKLGFPKSRINGYNKYYVMEIDAADHRTENVKEGEKTYKELQAQKKAQAEADKAKSQEDDVFNPKSWDTLYDDRRDDDDYED